MEKPPRLWYTYKHRPASPNLRGDLSHENALSKALRCLRRNRGLTQEQLAHSSVYPTSRSVAERRRDLS